MPIIAIDAMGGDHAPGEIVKGVARASLETDIDCLLVGDERRIQEILETVPYNPEHISIVDCRDAIGMDEDPHEAVKNRRDASLLVAARAVAEGRADAMISAGNTAACVLTCARYFRLLKGIRRAALASVYPRHTEYTGQDPLALMLDVGATRRRETPAQLAHRPRPPRARHRAPAPAHRLHAIRRSADPRLREPLHQVPRPLERPRRGQRGQGGCQGGARPGAGRDRRGGCCTPMSPLRIHRAQRPALAPVICRWDLDKTYLRSEFDSLRQLLRTAFERAEDKVEVPGVAALIKAIKRAAERHGREALVYFISASPPQIGKAIREKLALDGIPYDGIVFKDQLAQLKRGKLRNLREHVGFKLVELLRGRLDAPADARELLFGDDWESDSLIYSLYADVLAGRLAVDRLVPILRRIGVDARLVDQVVALAARVAGPDAVDRIFINLERRTPPATFRLFGPRVVPTFNYFQTAVVLGADGHLDVEDVAAVGRTLVEPSGYTARGLENSLGDLVRRAAVSLNIAERMGAELRAAGVLSAEAPARSRWRRIRDAFRRLRRRRKARRTPAGPPTRAAVDYAAILDRPRPPGRESPIEGRPA